MNTRKHYEKRPDTRRQGDGRGTVQAGRSGVEPPLVVEGRWLLRAFLLVVGAALVCGYLSLCLLFYQGQWQLVLHPTRMSARPATIGGLNYELIRFGPDATGVPQRTGWWIPARSDAPFRHLVLLYLPSGDGSLVDSIGTLEAIAGTGIPIFAIDWRGFGESANVHPSEQRMLEDADAAWQYLVSSRHIGQGRILPYGAGVGASIALQLAGQHGTVPAILLDGPRYDIEQEVRADPRVRTLPVGLLLRDRFSLEPALRESHVPKLIVTRGAQDDPRSLSAGDPKLTVAMPEFDPGILQATLRRFLSQYAPPTPVPSLVPQGQPETR